MSRPSNAPKAITAKTPEELRKRFLKIQLSVMAQLKVVSIYFDGTNHVLWYYPIGGFSTGVV